MTLSEALRQMSEQGIGWRTGEWADDYDHPTECCVMGAAALACSGGAFDVDKSSSVAYIVRGALSKEALLVLDLVPTWNDGQLLRQLRNGWGRKHSSGFEEYTKTGQVWDDIIEIIKLDRPDLAELELCERAAEDEGS